MAQQRGAEMYPGKDGKFYPISAENYYQGKIAICPVCGQRPCHWDCSEQMLPDPRPRPAFLDETPLCFCGAPEGAAHVTARCRMEGVTGPRNYREIDHPEMTHDADGDWEEYDPDEEQQAQPAMAGGRVR